MTTRIRPANQPAQPSRSACRSLRLEPLETRTLLSANVQRVLDLNTREVGSAPSGFVTIDDNLYFLAQGLGHQQAGHQLWKYDGKSATQVTHIAGDGVTTPPVAFAGSIYFGGDIGSENVELWRLHPPSGVLFPIDLVPEGDNIENGSEPQFLKVFDGRLFFSADVRDGSGRELWSYDGRTARRETNLNQVPLDPGGIGDGPSNPRELTILGDNLYFVAEDGIRGPAVWKFDGDQATLAAYVQPEVPLLWQEIHGLAPFDNQLYFLVRTRHPSTQLWRYDGENSGFVNVIGTIGFSDRSRGIEYNGQLYYFVTGQLWKLREFGLLRVGAVPTTSEAGVVVFRGELYFVVDDEEFTTGAELWKFNGQSAVRVTDINRAGDSFLPYLFAPDNDKMAVYHGGLYFAATDSHEHNVEVWKFDGDQTIKAIDARPGNAGSQPAITGLIDDTLFFFGTETGEESALFAFDGQRAQRVSSTLLAVTPLLELDGATVDASYFMARPPNAQIGLWKLQDRQASPVSDTCGGACPRMDWANIAFGDEFFFSAVEGKTQRELFKFDGQTFTRLAELPINGTVNAAVLDGTLYLAETPEQGQWTVLRYDGTTFEDVTGWFPPHAQLRYAVQLDGRAYFERYDEATGYELWSADLQGGGFRIEADLAPGVSSSQPRNLTVVGDTLYFTAAENPPDSFGRRLWKLENGQPVPLTPATLNVDSDSLDPIPVLGNRLVFAADATATGNEIWMYDGQRAELVADISPGPQDSSPGHFTVWGNRLYFAAGDPLHGRELWQLTFDDDADLDGDGRVSLADLMVLRAHFGTTSGAASDQGDINGDRAVNRADFSLFVRQFGQRAIPSSSPALASVSESTRSASNRPRLTATRAVRPAPAAIDAVLSATVALPRSAVLSTLKR
jgi:ELWxxDGT repeat protein